MPSAVATAFSVTPAQASGRMQPGDDKRLARFDLAAHTFADAAFRVQSDQRGVRGIAITFLQRSLDRPQVIGIHMDRPPDD